MNYPKLVRRPDVLALLKISRSNLYQKINQGLWTKPIHLSTRAVAWVESENEQVLAAMIAGNTQEEIKTLVKMLEQNRQQFKAVV
jgi:prophage regulatory protein